MKVDIGLLSKKELMTVVDNWTHDGERLAIFEKGDTLVLKKVRTGLSAFADNAYGDQMSLAEVVTEVHKVRKIS